MPVGNARRIAAIRECVDVANVAMMIADLLAQDIGVELKDVKL
jgi:hypothetical protein